MSHTPNEVYKYCVFVEGKNPPKIFHKSADEALTEASRLVHEGQGRRAFVMKVLYACDISVEVTTL